MSMPVEKAKKVLEAYKEHNYNAGQALKSVGYSGNNARANSGRTIDTAVNALVRANEKDALLEFVGLTSKQLADEYQSVITQNKNYPAKLRAMEPLLKKQGIQWDEEKSTTTVPILNVTVSKNDVAQPSDTPYVVQSTLSDIDGTAQPSPDITVP